MRKLIYFIIFIVSASVVPAQKSYGPVEAPAHFDSTNVVLYEYYLGAYIEPLPRLKYWPIRFRRDFKCEMPGFAGSERCEGYLDTTGIIGEWRVSSDTLFIYENYFEPLDSVIKDAYKNVFDDSIGVFVWGPKYRNMYEPMPPEKFNYPANVGVFLINDYGRSLDALPGSGAGIFLTHCSEAEYRYLTDLELPGWVKRPFDWTKGKYVVKDKLVFNGTPVMVVLDRSGIRFECINPTCLLKEYDIALYDKSDEDALTLWMDTVCVGKEYMFELSRPSYQIDYQEVGMQYRYLDSGKDSIYISRGDTLSEAYGYFFAKLVKP